jgi:transcriptional regulator with XRE-family HTH domain
MVISENLKKLRKKTVFSQQHIADVLGVDKNTYANWESGKSDVKSEYIPALAKIFEVEIQDLFKPTASKIEITQNYTENKDNSINGLVFVLTDKESVEKLISTLKGLHV